jgi:hypothetical protein
MKSRIVSIFTACLILIVGCEKEEQPTNKIIDGNYEGTFQREWVWEESETANVTFTFSSNEWSGSSENYNYPVLCRGTYSIARDTIIFKNVCVMTPELDWSLIFSGKYALSVDGDRIEFTRDYRSATSDTYIDRYVLYRKD